MADAVANGDNDTIPHRPGGEDDDNYSQRDPIQVDEEDNQNNSQDQQQQQQPPPPRRRPVMSRTESNSSRPREATELDEFSSPRPSSSASTASTASLSSGEYRTTPRQSNTIRHEASNETSNSTKHRHLQALRRFWTRHVVLNVPQQGNRDYFALERTFLAYMRTAATFSMQGVLVAQIFRLRFHKPNPTTHLNFHTIGVPLSVAYQACAILVALMGAYRFWRQQNAIARGKIISGGWELHWIGLLTFLAGVALFSLAVAITVEVG